MLREPGDIGNEWMNEAIKRQARMPEAFHWPQMFLRRWISFWNFFFNLNEKIFENLDLISSELSLSIRFTAKVQSGREKADALYDLC